MIFGRRCRKEEGPR